ncbi:MAG: hypothetical protein SPL96_11160 [Bacteroidales bacterium]|nr:hypothetical protein [Bacteroidales bacterium]
MATFDIKIGKADVLNEVRKTSAYLGVKSEGEDSYDRIALVSANDEQLERFWQECCALLNGTLHQWLAENRSDSTAYDVTLRPSESWNNALQPSVKRASRGFLVNSILSKWLMISAPGLVDGYSQVSASELGEVEQTMHRLKAPRHPS